MRVIFGVSADIQKRRALSLRDLGKNKVLAQTYSDTENNLCRRPFSL